MTGNILSPAYAPSLRLSREGPGAAGCGGVSLVMKKVTKMFQNSLVSAPVVMYLF
jgi:hypothetical protein